MNDRYSHVISILEVAAYANDCGLRIKPSWLLTNNRVLFAMCASTISQQTKYSMRLIRYLRGCRPRNQIVSHTRGPTRRR